MTLCLTWRESDNIYFATDSRLSVAQDSYADVAIKVLSIPFETHSPSTPADETSVDFAGEIGMYFASSVVNSLFVKESVTELVKKMQYAPGYTDTSMAGIAGLVFNAYKQISIQVCQTSIGRNGRAAIIIAGYCPEEEKLRALKFETDNSNNHLSNEILQENGEFNFLGTGTELAKENLPENPKCRNFLDSLNQVIKNE